MVGAACSLQDVVGIGEGHRRHQEAPVEIRTYAAEWVGVYEGLGNVDVFDSGEHYLDVPACLEMRVEDYVLYADLHLQIFPPPDVLVERPPVGGDAAGACAEGGAVVHIATGTGNVTSNATLTLNQPESSGESPRGRRLLLQRQGEDLVGTLTVYPGSGTGSATGTDDALASIALRVSSVDEEERAPSSSPP
jgi:hypothetical protein